MSVSLIYNKFQTNLIFTPSGSVSYRFCGSLMENFAVDSGFADDSRTGILNTLNISYA